MQKKRPLTVSTSAASHMKPAPSYKRGAQNFKKYFKSIDKEVWSTYVPKSPKRKQQLNPIENLLKPNLKKVVSNQIIRDKLIRQTTNTNLFTANNFFTSSRPSTASLLLAASQNQILNEYQHRLYKKNRKVRTPSSISSSGTAHFIAHNNNSNLTDSNNNQNNNNFSTNQISNQQINNFSNQLYSKNNNPSQHSSTRQIHSATSTARNTQDRVQSPDNEGLQQVSSRKQYMTSENFISRRHSQFDTTLYQSKQHYGTHPKSLSPAPQPLAPIVQIINDQYDDLMTKYLDLVKLVEKLQKKTLPLIKQGLDCCYPPYLNKMKLEDKELLKIQDNMKRVITLLLSNYQRMTLPDHQLFKLIDSGQLGKQFKMTHGNRFILQGYNFQKIPNIIQKHLQQSFSNKIRVELVPNEAQERQILSQLQQKSKKHYSPLLDVTQPQKNHQFSQKKLQDVEIEIKNIPIGVGYDLRQYMKVLRLHTIQHAINRQLEGFHKSNSQFMRKFEEKHSNKVSIIYSSYNPDGEEDLLIFQSVDQDYMKSMYSDFLKMKFDKKFFFEIDCISEQDANNLKQILPQKDIFVNKLGELWLKELNIFRNIDNRNGFSVVLSSRIEQKELMVNIIMQKIKGFRSDHIIFSPIQFQILNWSPIANNDQVTMNNNNNGTNQDNLSYSNLKRHIQRSSTQQSPQRIMMRNQHIQGLKRMTTDTYAANQQSSFSTLKFSYPPTPASTTLLQKILQQHHCIAQVYQEDEERAGQNNQSQGIKYRIKLISMNEKKLEECKVDILTTVDKRVMQAEQFEFKDMDRYEYKKTNFHKIDNNLPMLSIKFNVIFQKLYKTNKVYIYGEKEECQKCKLEIESEFNRLPDWGYTFVMDNQLEFLSYLECIRRIELELSTKIQYRVKYPCEDEGYQIILQNYDAEISKEKLFKLNRRLESKILSKLHCENIIYDENIFKQIEVSCKDDNEIVEIIQRNCLQLLDYENKFKKPSVVMQFQPNIRAIMLKSYFPEQIERTKEAIKRFIQFEKLFQFQLPDIVSENKNQLLRFIIQNIKGLENFAQVLSINWLQFIKLNKSIFVKKLRKADDIELQSGRFNQEEYQTLILFSTIQEKKQLEKKIVDSLNSLDFYRREINNLEYQLLKIQDSHLVKKMSKNQILEIGKQESYSNLIKAIGSIYSVFIKLESNEKKHSILMIGEEIIFDKINQIISDHFTQMRKNTLEISLSKEDFLSTDLLFQFNKTPRYNSSINGVIDIQFESSNSSHISFQSSQLRFKQQCISSFNSISNIIEKANLQVNRPVLPSIPHCRIKFYAERDGRHIFTELYQLIYTGLASVLNIPVKTQNSRQYLITQRQKKSSFESLFKCNLDFYNRQISEGVTIMYIMVSEAERQISQFKSDLLKKVQNRMDKMEFSRWYLFSPIHVLKKFQLYSEKLEYPFNIVQRKFSSEEGVWFFRQQINSNKTDGTFESRGDKDQQQEVNEYLNNQDLKWRKLYEVNEALCKQVESKYQQNILKFFGSVESKSNSNKSSNIKMYQYQANLTHQNKNFWRILINGRSYELQRRQRFSEMILINKHLAKNIYSKQLRNLVTREKIKKVLDYDDNYDDNEIVAIKDDQINHRDILYIEQNYFIQACHDAIKREYHFEQYVIHASRVESNANSHAFSMKYRSEDEDIDQQNSKQGTRNYSFPRSQMVHYDNELQTSSVSELDEQQHILVGAFGKVKRKDEQLQLQVTRPNEKIPGKVVQFSSKFPVFSIIEEEYEKERRKIHSQFMSCINLIESQQNKHWCHLQQINEGLNLIMSNVHIDSKEGEEISNAFNLCTQNKRKIVNIQRIQKLDAMKRYQLQKSNTIIIQESKCGEETDDEQVKSDKGDQYGFLGTHKANPYDSYIHHEAKEGRLILLSNNGQLMQRMAYEKNQPGRRVFQILYCRYFTRLVKDLPKSKSLDTIRWESSLKTILSEKEWPQNNYDSLRLSVEGKDQEKVHLMADSKQIYPEYLIEFY